MFEEACRSSTDGGEGEATNPGPYAQAAATLVARNAPKIRSLLGRHDESVRQARQLPDRMVLTHGETHPGNTMLTPGGWVLIDWDTLLLAPPERDLWMLAGAGGGGDGAGDPSVLAIYAHATGIRPRTDLLGLYRIRCDLTDMAGFVRRFQEPHAGSVEDEACWNFLCSLLEESRLNELSCLRVGDRQR